MNHKKFLQINGKKGQAALRKKYGNEYNNHMSEIALNSHKNRKKRGVADCHQPVDN